jgi:hypothetical protein
MMCLKDVHSYYNCGGTSVSRFHGRELTLVRFHGCELTLVRFHSRELTLVHTEDTQYHDDVEDMATMGSL